jgi:hypothetical protein
MNTKRRALPVLLERDFRKMAASEGATVEIECVSAPNPDDGSRGNGCSTLSAPRASVSCWSRPLRGNALSTRQSACLGSPSASSSLDHLDVPAVAGAVCTGMRSLPGGSDPLE